jgi:hypothetical protein
MAKVVMEDKFWLREPEDHDFPAAQDYLELFFAKERAAAIVERLRKAQTVVKKAKDVLRASGLPLLNERNIHVHEDVHKVKKGKKLSPVLLVIGQPLIIADGYHRVCAIYVLSEDLEIPCRLVSS